jgi:hypothetical protein
MRIRSLKWYKYVHHFIRRYRDHFPTIVWSLLYNPISRRFREKSFSEELEEYSEKVSLDSFVKIYGEHKLWKKNNYILKCSHEKQRIIKLNKCIIKKNGIIIESNTIHKSSALYRRLSIAQIAEVFGIEDKTDLFIKEGTIVSRQFVDQGTYGDYITEFLIPLVNAKGHVRGPILIDADFIKEYCETDLKKIKLDFIYIPFKGISVQKLNVIGPAQVFDNYNSESVRVFQRAFPLNNRDIRKEKGQNDCKIYLSRKNLKSSNEKQNRILRNESELIEELNKQGFTILEPHKMCNDDIRSFLSRADTIIFPAGSAFFNLAWSKPKKVVEIADDRIWNPSPVRYAHALNIKNYNIVTTINGEVSINNILTAIR